MKSEVFIDIESGDNNTIRVIRDGKVENEIYVDVTRDYKNGYPFLKLEGPPVFVEKDCYTLKDLDNLPIDIMKQLIELPEELMEPIRTISKVIAEVLKDK